MILVGYMDLCKLDSSFISLMTPVKVLIYSPSLTIHSVDLLQHIQFLTYFLSAYHLLGYT